jgi:hypothetical protein
MGHNRLGRLPRTRRWREVVSLLDQGPEATSRVAGAVVQAAESALRELANDPVIADAIQTLIRITWASRSASFNDELRALGLSAADTSALSVIAAIGDHIRESVARHPESSYFGEIAALAARSALTDTVLQQGPGLFSSSADDVQRAFREYSTRDRFGELARRFFADFMSRSLRSWVDRELSNHVGQQRVGNIAEASDFLKAIDTYTWQAARIVEDFAGGWYSKRNWELGGEITRDEAQKFVAVSLRKLRAELRIGATA